jgi:hypothetical protein
MPFMFRVDLGGRRIIKNKTPRQQMAGIATPYE